MVLNNKSIHPYAHQTEVRAVNCNLNVQHALVRDVTLNKCLPANTLPSCLLDYAITFYYFQNCIS